MEFPGQHLIGHDRLQRCEDGAAEAKEEAEPGEVVISVRGETDPYDDEHQRDVCRGAAVLFVVEAIQEDCIHRSGGTDDLVEWDRDIVPGLWLAKSTVGIKSTIR